MTPLRFTVPGTPRPKARHRYRIVKRKGAVISPYRLSAYHTLYWRGWNKLVRASVLRVLVDSVRTGKALMRVR